MTAKLQTLEQKSKYLSFLLRHSPESAKLDLDDQGWCSIEQLLENTSLSLDDLEKIVKLDAKQRYSMRYWEMGGEGLPFTSEPVAIRANQGHSTPVVKLKFKQQRPPAVLLHGTVDSNVTSIMRQGLRPMSRHHVHLSEDATTALQVGGRRKGKIVVLQVDAAAMHAMGHHFFISDNGVWLVDSVPPEFIKEPQ